jgi:hypothetical protein
MHCSGSNPFAKAAGRMTRWLEKAVPPHEIHSQTTNSAQAIVGWGDGHRVAKLHGSFLANQKLLRPSWHEEKNGPLQKFVQDIHSTGASKTISHETL